MIEIERRFLVRTLPPILDSTPCKSIEQGYYRADDHQSLQRIRRIDGRCIHTIKHGKGLVRKEIEKEISEQEFNQLWLRTEGRRLRKKRYFLPFGEWRIELDVYEDALEGFFIAEVEFPSVEDSKNFTPPAWFGPEVTERDGFTNSHFAEFGVPEAYRELIEEIS